MLYLLILSRVLFITLVYLNQSHSVPRFRPQAVKEAVQNLLSDRLSGKVYANEDMAALTKEIAVSVRERVTGTDLCILCRYRTCRSVFI